LPDGAEEQPLGGGGPCVLDRWLREVVGTPGLTSIRDPDEARRVLLDDALRGVNLVAREAGSIVDVGSGGGTPGIPLAASLPERTVTLLEAERRKCDVLERWTVELPNLRVVWGRAEEQPLEQYGVAVAKALAHPPTAAEWCLPLVREGGAVLLWVGPSAEPDRVTAVADRIAGRLEPAPAGFLLIRKFAPTPPGFPRRPGMARKRPLA
jgi:16S rRNA (guanine527-N7)-methyltransferase